MTRNKQAAAASQNFNVRLRVIKSGSSDRRHELSVCGNALD
jgi:hypothetical protein